MSDDINRWIDLATAADQDRDYSELLRAADEIVRLAPHAPQAFFLRGVACMHLDRMEEACAAFRTALLHNPNYIDAWINLGACSQELNLNDEAIEAAHRAIKCAGQEIDAVRLMTARDEDFGDRHWNLAVLELLTGDYKNGFSRYASRYKALGRERPDFAQPLWRGEDLRGKTITITAEQGHGDTLMMARYLPLLKRRGAKILLRAQPGLVPYFKNWDRVDAVFLHEESLPAFDFHASEFDLPRFFGTELSNVPTAPYLPKPKPIDKLLDTGHRRIAMTWAGFAGHANDRNRSAPLAALESIFKTPRIDFYALTRDKRPGDDALLQKWGVTDLAPKLTDFSDTARYIAQMDLIISCDTSIAHLAGGMGKPVWVMLPFAPSWAWGTNESSPWYPSARLFRQKKRGDWDNVSEIIAEFLSA